MNKLIKEIAERATQEVLQNTPSFLVTNEMWKQKFAELLVQECIAQASIGNGHGNNQWDKALSFAADNIKKHFGVKP